MDKQSYKTWVTKPKENNMSPKGDKKVNIGILKAMFSQYGFSRNHWTTFEVDGDPDTPITGHCLMGALGHAYEIGNSAIWQIALDTIKRMPDAITYEAVKGTLRDIARISTNMTNTYR